MILLTEDLRAQLRANAVAQREAQQRGMPEPDPVPVVKFFNPMGAATWLVTEIEADGDTLFGLADLGFGCPELGSFSLAEIASVRLAFGLGIERDLGFESSDPLSVWAETARRCGTLVETEARLRRAARVRPEPARAVPTQIEPSRASPDTATASDTHADPHPEIPAPPASPHPEGPKGAGEAG
jgi:Protein of unknown function (DUF2958)